MIVIYKVLLNDAWPDLSPGADTDWLPPAAAARIRAYRSVQDRRQRLAGRMALATMLRHFGLQPSWTLSDLIYTPEGRPVIPGSGLSFSLSHAGNLVVGAGTLDGDIGVDIAQPSDTLLPFLPDYFTSREQQLIRSAPDPAAMAAQCWTRKEAVLKALGTGLTGAMNQLDTTAAPVRAGARSWYLQPLALPAPYLGTLATAWAEQPQMVIDANSPEDLLK